MPAPLQALGAALETIASLPISGALTPPLPVYAHTVAGGAELYWYLPLGLECQLDVDNSGTNDIGIRVDPVLSGTSVVGITVRVQRLSSVVVTVAIGLRSDGGLVTGSPRGNWVLTRVAHQSLPLPDATTIVLRSTGAQQNPGDIQDTEITLAAQGTSVASCLAHALRLDVLAGESVDGVIRSARRPSLIPGLGAVLPLTQNINVADPATLAGVATRLAGATGPLAGAGPHLSLRQRATFLELLGTDKISRSELTLDSAQRLHVFATTVDPATAPSYVELRNLSPHIVVDDTPQLTGSGASRRLDGNALRVETDEVTETATLRVPTDTGGVAATIWALAALQLRLRGDAPLLIELHGGTGPDDPLDRPLGGVVARGIPGTHPVGTLDQPLELSPQAAVVDLQGSAFFAALRVPRRVRVRERVVGIHALAAGPAGAQDWLVDVDFGDPRDTPFERDVVDGTRPLRVRVRDADSSVLVRAVDLPERLSLDLHLDAPGTPRNVGARLHGAIEGLRFLADLPPSGGAEARMQIHAALPTVPADGFDLQLRDNLPLISAAAVTTAIVAGHGLGVAATGGGLPIDSIDVLARIPATAVPGGATVATHSVAITARDPSGGISTACARPAGARVALTAPATRRLALRPTPQVALGFAQGPPVATTADGPPLRRVTARVVGLREVAVGGQAPASAGPLALPTARLLLDRARVNRAARVHTFEDDRNDLRVRIADVPDELSVDLRSAPPEGIDGALPAASGRAATRVDLEASAPSGEIVLWGEPTARLWYGPQAGRRAGTGLVTGTVRSLPRRLSFLSLHDPALLSGTAPERAAQTRPALWPGIPADWIRDGLQFAVSEEILICRLATVRPDRGHPSDGTAMWTYSYIHALRIAPQTAPGAGTSVEDLPSLTIWTPFKVPSDQDTFDENESAVSVRVGPRDGHGDSDRPRVDLWLGQLERLVGTGEVHWRDLMPATAFTLKSELLLSGFGGHFAAGEPFGTFDPTRVDANGPGSWWIRAVGKLPLLGYDVTLGSDGIQVFASRPDFSDPCGS